MHFYATCIFHRVGNCRNNTGHYAKNASLLSRVNFKLGEKSLELRAQEGRTQDMNPRNKGIQETLWLLKGMVLESKQWNILMQ